MKEPEITTHKTKRLGKGVQPYISMSIYVYIYIYLRISLYSNFRVNMTTEKLRLWNPYRISKGKDLTDKTVIQ